MKPPKTPQNLSHSRKLILSASAVVLLTLLGFAWYVLASPNHFTPVETLTHRTVQDATSRFFKNIASNNQSGIDRDLATPPQSNDTFSKAAARRDEVIKIFTAQGVASTKIDDVIWVKASFLPTTSAPDEATDALVTVRVIFRSGSKQVFYVRMWDNTPQTNQSAYTGAFQFTRDWKVVDINTEKPPFPYINVDDSAK